MEAIFAGCSQHSDGWGCVIHADNGLFHYRTSTSIYEDDMALPRMEGEIRAIFHGRAASDAELTGHIFSHPFMAAADNEVLFLAHNGSVQPDRLPERKVDSEWALEQIIQAGGLAQAQPKLQDSTLSSLNLLVLHLDRRKGAAATLQFLNYFKSREPAAEAYYRMYLGTMPGGRALVSSTFKLESAQVSGLAITGPAAFGEISTLEP
jgi:predicted glutamine amidotransferase